MSDQNAPLISTLRSLQLKSLKEVSVGNKLASILDRPVYNALFPHGSHDGSHAMLEEAEWDENDTLLALAGRSSDRPLRAWLGVAVDHSMVTEAQANAMHRALRERYGPQSEEHSSPYASGGPLAVNLLATNLFTPANNGPEKTSMGTLRVCRQCRRDHQRCDRAAGKQCKRCVEHGWNCAESVPKSPSGSKRKRTDDDVQTSLPRQTSPEEEEEDVPEVESPEQELAPAPAEIAAEQPDESALADEEGPDREPSPPPQKRRSISAASSGKSRRQRSLSTNSNRDEKPALRELRTLERETQIPGSKRKRQTSAIDVALEKMGLRKTPANVAFCIEAGLCSLDADGTRILEDVVAETAEDAVEHSVPVDNKAADDDDVESNSSSHAGYSFFDSAAGTPATVSDPHLARETSGPPSSGPLAKSVETSS